MNQFNEGVKHRCTLHIVHFTLEIATQFGFLQRPLFSVNVGQCPVSSLLIPWTGTGAAFGFFFFTSISNCTCDRLGLPLFLISVFPWNFIQLQTHISLMCLIESCFLPFVLVSLRLPSLILLSSLWWFWPLLASFASFMWSAWVSSSYRVVMEGSLLTAKCFVFHYLHYLSISYETRYMFKLLSYFFIAYLIMEGTFTSVACMYVSSFFLRTCDAVCAISRADPRVVLIIDFAISERFMGNVCRKNATNFDAIETGWVMMLQSLYE